MILEGEFRWKEAHFMAYAACNWTVHYNSQDSAARAELCQAARDICRTACGRGPAWAIHFESRDFRTDHEYASHCSDLTLASYFGLLDVAEHIIREENVDVNSEGGYFGTAIKAAAAGGQLSLVQALTQHDADFETGGGCFPTALVAAFAQGHLNVAQYLIGRGHRITQEVVEAAVSEENDVQQIAHLIENFKEHVTITEEVTEAAAANPIWGADILAFLLDRCGDQVGITQEILKTATANEGCGDEIMSLLIDTRGDALDITEETLKSAAGNSDCGAEIMRLLIEEYGDVLDITSAVFQTAAGTIDGFATMKLLMQEGCTNFEITQEVILAAAKRGSEDMMKFCLDESRDMFQLTPELILAVAGNSFYGGKMMTLLLQTFGNRVIITQDVIMTAAQASYGDETLAVLLNHRGSDLKITNEIVIAAAMNTDGEGPMAYLLEQHRMEVEITQELISAVQGNRMLGKRMMALLRDKRGDEVKLYEREQV
ncbi:nacht and ankyrin domain protein [Colletotrichum chrysophilum]|uniref:Nacht and ankyrin domain protein n=1 Tax=Colletotrichum chrysophilum TaxID=1836956 RepID=A0AAD9AKZ1_9PEZI|nr:nacht and ankyrin domain protein [Colletotrichum chrysophilum]